MRGEAERPAFFTRVFASGVPAASEASGETPQEKDGN
jgi:hypothetical protein